MRILVVDDEPDFLATCVRLLALMGHEAVAANDVPDAISQIDNRRLDLIITDLRMRPLDGHAVLQHAQRRRPPLPVIVVTGHPSPEIAQAVRAAGALLLPKPITPQELKAAIDRTLSR